MATLADSFLQDLEDIEERDADEEATGPKNKGKAKEKRVVNAVGEDSDDEIPDAVQAYEAAEKSGSSSVSEMLKNDEFQKLMDEVRERKDEQPALELGKQLSEEDTEYPLITRCNSLVREIDEEMLNIHRFVRDIYSKKFPELESIVVSPLDYLQVVQRIGNTKDLTAIDFSDILPNTAVMAITVTASMTGGTQLQHQELDKMLVACDEAFLLNDCKRDVLLYLESRMSGLAPNLSALLGAALAAKLITAAGGLLNLARMPAQNIMLVGSQKKALLGMASSSYHTQGIILASDLILSTPMEFRNRAVKLVAGKCGLAARVDSFHESPLGQVGTQLREKILQSLAKAQEPPPAKQKKTLPPPEDKPRAKRGGKRHRRIKEKYGQTEFRKLVNRVKFGVDAEENIYTEEWGLGIPFFEGKPQALKSAKVSKEKQLQQHIKAQKRQRTAAAAGNESGLSSSLAFTPVQGIELANPNATRKAPDVGEKYFSNTAGFVNLSTPLRNP
jgi:U4/U6 small nuclear ribonucleoprotein PRP31